MEHRADGDWVRFEDYGEVEKQRDNLRAEVERLREAARQVHRLTGWNVDSAATIALRDIHNITKGMVE